MVHGLADALQPRKVPCPARGHRQSGGELLFAWFGNIQGYPRKGLGLIITADLKSSAQCIAAEKKTQMILGYNIIKRVFRIRNKQTVVRPLLEDGAQFWSPIRRVDVERLEKVRARATKLVPSVRHKGYQRRLADLGLFAIEQRRIHFSFLLIYIFPEEDLKVETGRAI